MSKTSEEHISPISDTEIVDLDAPQEQRSATWVRILWSPTAWSVSVLLILCLIFTVQSPNSFFTLFNLRAISITASNFLVMGVGVTFVLSAGGLDLSVGSVLVMTGVVGVKVMVLMGGGGWPTIIVGLLACVVSGAMIGLLNGALIALLRIPALVATLGTNFGALGIAYVLSGGQDLRGVPDLMGNTVGVGLWLGIPILVWIAALVGVVGSLVYSTTRFGRYTQAIGSSQEAAIRAGVRVNLHLIKLYTLSGLLAGLAGFLALAQFGTTSLSGHDPDFLYVLLAVILGGTSLFGGVGTVAGTCLAVFIPWVLNDGFIILGVDPYWQYIALGAIFIVVVYLDALRRRAREKVRY